MAMNLETAVDRSYFHEKARDDSRLRFLIWITRWASNFVGAGHARDQTIRGHGPLLQISNAVSG
jgi:hypothetical protein